MLIIEFHIFLWSAILILNYYHAFVNWEVESMSLAFFTLNAGRLSAFTTKDVCEVMRDDTRFLSFVWHEREVFDGTDMYVKCTDFDSSSINSTSPVLVPKKF